MCDVAWYNEFVGLNAFERRRRDLIVAYAERQGGGVQEYLERMFPRYWLSVERIPAGSEGDSLGLTVEQQVKVLADMGVRVLAGLKAAPEFGQPHAASDLRRPTSVPHL
jgi:hypothetical protein